MSDEALRLVEALMASCAGFPLDHDTAANERAIVLFFEDKRAAHEALNAITAVAVPRQSSAVLSPDEEAMRDESWR